MFTVQFYTFSLDRWEKINTKEVDKSKSNRATADYTPASVIKVFQEIT